MKGKSLIIGVVLVGALTLLIAWVARNTYWDEIKIPSALKNEAARNPFYGAQHIVESLGATSTWDRIQREVSPGAVIVASSWHWISPKARRTRMERWVESGGRLVLDRTLVGGQEEFERWSGISRRLPQRAPGETEDEEDRAAGSPPKARRDCRPLHETARADRDNSGTHSNGARSGARAESSADAVARAAEAGGVYELCAPEDRSQLVTTRPVAWALRDDWGNQVLRVRVGKGSVTVINAVPFRFRQILEGDDAALLVAAAQLRRGDEVHFLSEEDHPSMLTLMWLLGWPWCCWCLRSSRWPCGGTACGSAHVSPSRISRAAHWRNRFAAPASSSYASAVARRCMRRPCAR
ncbi:MAG: hypothetical protein WDO56_37350 [Gammaproteobacteria bacterium]